MNPLDHLNLTGSVEHLQPHNIIRYWKQFCEHQNHILEFARKIGSYNRKIGNYTALTLQTDYIYNAKFDFRLIKGQECVVHLLLIYLEIIAFTGAVWYILSRDNCIIVHYFLVYLFDSVHEESHIREKDLNIIFTPWKIITFNQKNHTLLITIVYGIVTD